MIKSNIKPEAVLVASTVLQDDCFVLDQPRITHAQAVHILRTRLQPVASIESVDVAHGSLRVLAQTAVAQRNIPQHTNSAVDGYAFTHNSDIEKSGAVLPVLGRAAAGRALAGPAASGAAVRILTGAVLPPELDTIVMQEDVTLEDRPGTPAFQNVRIPAGSKRGANVRLAGEDVAAGAVLYEPGHVLRPQDLAALASAGLGHVRCYTPLRIGVFSTGDEVVRSGAPLKEGQVYDANAPMIAALVAATGSQAEDLGILPDDPAVVRQRLSEASARFDVLITSGGASKGEEDYVVRVLDEIGKRHLWQIAIKPGRPMSFGQIGSCVFIGLPGNPVAVFVCFLLYAWPMLRRLSGAPWPTPRAYQLPSLTAIKKKTGRREYWRGILREHNGRLMVEKFDRDGSGLITSLRVADGLIEAGEDLGAVAAGDLVTFIPFTEFGILRP
jgi:molybdopterin molybdotransferase